MLIKKLKNCQVMNYGDLTVFCYIRACLKNHFCNLYALLYGIFSENICQTHSKVYRRNGQDV